MAIFDEDSLERMLELLNSIFQTNGTVLEMEFCVTVQGLGDEAENMPCDDSEGHAGYDADADVIKLYLYL